MARARRVACAGRFLTVALVPGLVVRGVGVAMRFLTLGVGALASPRYAPAGLLVSHAGRRVVFDAGPGAEPGGRVDAWLVTDEHAELIRPLRRLARGHGLTPAAQDYRDERLVVERHPVVHTNHPTFGYRISTAGGRGFAVWAPEFLQFPEWAAGAAVMFAEAAAWNRPILFRGRVGGHLDVLTTAREAKRRGVRRLVFAHIGRPVIRAIDRGERPPYGEWSHDGQIRWLR